MVWGAVLRGLYVYSGGNTPVRTLSGAKFNVLSIEGKHHGSTQETEIRSDSEPRRGWEDPASAREMDAQGEGATK